MLQWMNGRLCVPDCWAGRSGWAMAVRWNETAESLGWMDRRPAMCEVLSVSARAGWLLCWTSALCWWKFEFYFVRPSTQPNCSVTVKNCYDVAVLSSTHYCVLQCSTSDCIRHVWLMRLERTVSCRRKKENSA